MVSVLRGLSCLDKVTSDVTVNSERESLFASTSRRTEGERPGLRRCVLFSFLPGFVWEGRDTLSAEKFESTRRISL